MTYGIDMQRHIKFERPKAKNKMKTYHILAAIVILILGMVVNVSAISFEFMDVVFEGFNRPIFFNEERDVSTIEMDGIRHCSILFWLEDYNLDLGADIFHLQDNGYPDLTLNRNLGGWDEIRGLHSVLTASAERPSAPVPTPEPASIILFGIGLIGFAAYRKKSKSK